MLATACIGALLVHLALKALVEAPLGHPRVLDCSSFAAGAAGHPQRTRARACHIIEAIGAT